MHTKLWQYCTLIIIKVLIAQFTDITLGQQLKTNTCNHYFFFFLKRQESKMEKGKNQKQQDELRLIHPG